MINLILLSTASVKIHQFPYVIFETISHFLQHNSSISFSSESKYLLKKWPIKVQIIRLSTAQVNVHQITHVIFQIKCQLFFKVWIFFQCHDR